MSRAVSSGERLMRALSWQLAGTSADTFSIPIPVIVIQTDCNLEGPGIRQVRVHEPCKDTVAVPRIKEWDILHAIRDGARRPDADSDSDVESEAWYNYG